MSPIHRAAGEGYAQVAGTYEQGRPEYPEELLPWLRDSLGAVSGAEVVDLGAGTGKFTRLLCRTAVRVTAVEPVAAMRRTLEAEVPQVAAVIDGTAEAMGLPAASADALTCAQSFHWFATPAALAEIHRVIKPGGRLGLVWNVRETSVPWVAAISRLFEPFEAGTPRHHTGEWRRAFEAAQQSGAFGELHETTWPYAHEGPIEDVVIKRFLSVSFIAALPATERTVIERRVRELVATHPDLRGRERVAAPYRTHAYWSVRR